jgi:hypothetical protein
VPGAVHELLAVPGLGDDVAGHGVDLGAGHPRADGGDRGRLGALQDGEPLLEPPGGHAADDVGAGAVGAVAAGGAPTDVDDHEVAGLDDPVGELVVRAGAVRARGDDREVHGHVALGQDRRGDVGAHLGLGAPGPQPLLHPGVHPVDGRTRGGQLLDLGRGLDHPQPVDDRAGQLQDRTRQCLLHPQGVLGPGARAHGDPGGCSTQPLGDRGGQDGEGVVRLVPGQHLQPERAGGRGAHHRRLQPGHDQQGLTAARHDQRRQPLHGVGVVAAQVAQVGARGDDEDVDAELVGHGTGTVHPVDRHQRGRGSRGGGHVGRLASRDDDPAHRVRPVTVPA